MAATATAKPKVKKVKEKKEKVKRIPFAQSEEARSLLDENGRLTGTPGEAFDGAKHLAPKKKDFSAEHVYMRFRAEDLEVKANDYAERAGKLREQADIMEKQPDPAIRNQVKRMARLKEQLAKLEADLKADGIPVEDLGV